MAATQTTPDLRVIYYPHNSSVLQQIFDYKTTKQATTQARSQLYTPHGYPPPNLGLRNLADALYECLFGNNPKADLLIAVEQGTIVAACLVFCKIPLPLEDGRRQLATCLECIGSTVKGGGTALLSAGAKIALSHKKPLKIHSLPQAEGFYEHLLPTATLNPSPRPLSDAHFPRTEAEFIWRGEQLHQLAAKSQLSLEQETYLPHLKLPTLDYELGPVTSTEITSLAIN